MIETFYCSFSGINHRHIRAYLPLKLENLADLVAHAIHDKKTRESPMPLYKDIDIEKLTE